jgi:hypothetical protein
VAVSFIGRGNRSTREKTIITSYCINQFYDEDNRYKNTGALQKDHHVIQ